MNDITILRTAIEQMNELLDSHIDSHDVWVKIQDARDIFQTELEKLVRRHYPTTEED